MDLLAHSALLIVMEMDSVMLVFLEMDNVIVTLVGIRQPIVPLVYLIIMDLLAQYAP
jgi:hypothetical protein